MKTATIAEIRQMEDGTVVPYFAGILKKVYPEKATSQIIEVGQGDDSMYVEVFKHAGAQRFTGSECGNPVTMLAHTGPDGLVGLTKQTKKDLAVLSSGIGVCKLADNVDLTQPTASPTKAAQPVTKDEDWLDGYVAKLVELRLKAEDAALSEVLSEHTEMDQQRLGRVADMLYADLASEMVRRAGR